MRSRGAGRTPHDGEGALDDLDGGFDVRAEENAGDGAEREPRHLVEDVDGGVRRGAPLLGDGRGLGGDRLGVAVDAAAGEERLDEPALA